MYETAIRCTHFFLNFNKLQFSSFTSGHNAGLMSLVQNSKQVWVCVGEKIVPFSPDRQGIILEGSTKMLLLLVILLFQMP